jgi:hypothetical protein
MVDLTKPLFIPLREEHFLAFERGDKTEEFRKLSAQFCHRTCPPGRRATLSLGYSGRRLTGTVRGFRHLAWRDAPEAAQKIYAGASVLVGIKIELDAP